VGVLEETQALLEMVPQDKVILEVVMGELHTLEEEEEELEL
jgi:hypothetical protein